MGQKLTPQFLLKKLKRKLGVKAIVLPYNDEELMDVFYEETLPTFSIYFPAKLPYKVDLSYCKRADKVAVPSPGESSYHINIPENINVIEIEDIEYLDSKLNTYWASPMGALDSYEIFTSEIMQSRVESMMAMPITHRFIEPDILVIDESTITTNNVIKMSLLVEHAKDLSTVKFTYLDFIMELFIIDVKIALYEEMKHYDKVDTTFSQIDLKIDDWQDAKSERKDLIDKWDGKFLSHRTKTIYRV